MPTESEVDLLFENLSCSGAKPAILSLIPKFTDSYMPKSSHAGFPQRLKSLEQSSYLDLHYHELLKVCESASVEVTDEMAKFIEKVTRSRKPVKTVVQIQGWKDHSMKSSSITNQDCMLSRSLHFYH